MGKCSARHFVLTVCTLQLIVVVECQVFDFLGFMYGPILANFFHIIFIILGFFGAFQYSTKYIISYALWNIFWVGWTIFIICFYLDTGVLNKDSDILNLGTGSRSWWEIHGFGCIADFTSVVNGSSLEQDPDLSRPPKPIKVEGCLIEYQYVEVMQASVQCLLGILAIVGGFYMSKIYIDEDDSLLFFWNNAKSLRQIELQPIYVSSEFKRWKVPWLKKNRVRFKRSEKSKFDARNQSNRTDGYVKLKRNTFTTVDEYLKARGTQIKEPQGPPMCPPNYTFQASRGHLDEYQQQIRGNGYGPRSVSPRPMTPRRVKRRSILARDTMNRASLTHRRQGSSRSRSSQRRARAHQNPVTRLLEQQNRFLDVSVTSTSFNDSSLINAANILSSRDDGNDFEAANRLKIGLNNPVFQQSSNSSLNQSGGDEIYRPNSARSSYSNYHASRPVSCLHNKEYFSNQAVAQVPISTNRNKGTQRGEEPQNNLNPSKSTATLKSFSQKNFNFLGFNLKNNNINNNNNNFSSNYNSSNNALSGSLRNSKRFRVDLTRTSERTSNFFFSQGPPAYREGGLDSETVI